VTHLLEVIDVDVFYGDAQAIWDVSFHVTREKIVALVGANGAGKTTLLNTVSGMLQPRAGVVRFSGKSLDGLKPEQVVALGISHVPEGRRLFSRLTVSENLELGAFPPRARPHLHTSLDRAFNLFPVLKARVHQTAGSLSGGEQQMLAIARALMARPILLMLDEPSLGLAPIVVKLMFETVQVLCREGVTILLVEQNVHQTLEMAHHVYVLKTGRVELDGRGHDLLVNPDFQQAYLGIRG
jgi:branched-chain amino acid transport system ATP-binding protein